MKHTLKTKGKSLKLTTLGFTLIELLAVIMILAIVATIATPIVLNIIEDTKKSAVKRSSELYINAVELTLAKASMDNIDLTTCNVEDKNLKCEDKEYKIELEGEPPKEVEIKATKEGKVYTAIKTDGYCVIKSEDQNKYLYKKIVENVKDPDKEIKNNMCSLDPYTSEQCFAFDESTGTITNYYETKDGCSDQVVIPRKINGVEVKILGARSFAKKQIIEVVLTDTIKSIEHAAFHGNYITQLKIPEGVEK